MPNIELFTPYKAQKDFIDKFVDTDDLFGCLVAPRGSGKSLAAMNIALYWALSKPNQKLGWCAPTFSQSKNILDQIVTAANEIILSSNRQEATITFINGSTIKFLSSDSADNIRGFRFTHLILDEFAYIKPTVIDTILLPTLNPSGIKCLMVSTPAGKNHMFTWYNKPEVVSHKIPLTECPYISQELINEAKKSLPADIFAQEYLAEFRDSANDVFVGVDKVSTVQNYDIPSKQEVFVGIDTGLSDDSSVLALISPIGRVLGIHTMGKTDLNTVATRFTHILNQYNVVGGYIEINGVGRGTYDLISPNFRKIRSFTTNQDNKTDMVRKLIHDIETMTVELPTRELCPELHSEFATYTYKLSGTGKLSFTHSNGAHDDHIDALLLANYSRVQFMDRKPLTIGSHKQINTSWGVPR